jgi:LysR family transcriptional regulator, nod-box dependent transcriptional activator
MRLRKFDLNLLKALDALLAERSVTKAAENLYVTQQAMSGSLRRLREHFEDPLLVRMGREMELTPLARSLVIPLREALLNLDSTLRVRPMFDPQTTSRSFRLAISDYGSFVILPRVLQVLAKEAPKITLCVSALGDQSFNALERGDLDFFATTSQVAQLRAQQVSENIRKLVLFKDDFVCLADEAHPELREGMTEELYRQLPHTVTHFTIANTLVERAWIRHELEPYIASTAPGFATMIFMLPGTPAIGTAQRKLAVVLGAALKLRLHECPIPIDPVEESLFWHERSSEDPAHAFLRLIFQKVAVELSAVPAKD